MVASRGVIRVWHGEDGWGVLDSSETPGGCWFHFSAWGMPGEPAVAQVVEFGFVAGLQDGYGYRAQWVGKEVPVVESEPGGFYTSRLSVEWDSE